MNNSEFDVVVPSTPNDEIVMVKRNDYKSGSLYLDLPSDRLEQLESPAEASKRILMQIGFEAKEIRLIRKYKVHDIAIQKGSIFHVYGYVLESRHLAKLALAEVEQMLLRNEIRTTSSIIALHRVLQSKQDN